MENTTEDVASTNITIIQVSSTSVKDNLPPPQNESAEKIETTTTNFMNNVQIIPSNYTSTEQNATVTVQVTNDSNTSGEINEQVSPSTSKSLAISKTGITAVAIASDLHNDVKNGRNFGAVTNISIGEQQQQQQQRLPPASTESHYEQVFIMHTPSTASVSTTTCNVDQSNDNSQPKINRIKVIDSVHRTENADVQPSTSTVSSDSGAGSSNIKNDGNSIQSATVTATTSTADSNAPNLINIKAKDGIKNRSVENNLENDTSLLCRRPLLSRGLTEAVIMRQSRKDVNMLLNRINPQGNHVSFRAQLQS